VCAKLIFLIAIFRKQLFGSGIQRSGCWPVVQPIEMIGSGKDQRRVRGLECVGGVPKISRPSLGCYVTVSEKGVPQPTEKDRHNQSDN
jgi:hypothetical protein